MKLFRIIYWFGSCTTECYVRAIDKENALRKFNELKGDRMIMSVEECREDV